jgi:hypothetical protein
LLKALPKRNAGAKRICNVRSAICDEENGK